MIKKKCLKGLEMTLLIAAIFLYWFLFLAAQQEETFSRAACSLSYDKNRMGFFPFQC